MLFYFNLFNYRTEKELDNVFEAYDHFMQLMDKFHIDIELAKECYSVQSYIALFGIKLGTAQRLWGDEKQTNIRHCNFGILDIGIPTMHVKLSKERLKNFIEMLDNIKNAAERSAEHRQLLAEKSDRRKKRLTGPKHVLPKNLDKTKKVISFLAGDQLDQKDPNDGRNRTHLGTAVVEEGVVL